MQAEGHDDADEAADEGAEPARSGRLQSDGVGGQVAQPGDETQPRAHDDDASPGAVVDGDGHGHQRGSEELQGHRSQGKRLARWFHRLTDHARDLESGQDAQHHAERVSDQFEDAAHRREREAVDGVLGGPDDRESREHEHDAGGDDHRRADLLRAGERRHGEQRAEGCRQGEDEGARDLAEEVRHTGLGESVLRQRGEDRGDEGQHDDDPRRTEHDRHADGQHALGDDDGGRAVSEGGAPDAPVALGGGLRIQPRPDVGHEGLHALQPLVVGCRPADDPHRGDRPRGSRAMIGRGDRVVGDVDVHLIQPVGAGDAHDGQRHLARRGAGDEHRLAHADRELDDLSGERVVDHRERFGKGVGGDVAVDEVAKARQQASAARGHAGASSGWCEVCGASMNRPRWPTRS